MDMRKEMWRAGRALHEEKEKAALRLQEASAKRLTHIITTKIRTAFVGPLSILEDRLGWLWGHGLDVADCTPEQLEARLLWEQIRQEILNNGNTQLRAAQSELTQYDVKWNGATRLRLSVLRPEDLEKKDDNYV